MFSEVALYIIVPSVLLVGMVLAGAAKLVLGARSRLSFTTSVIVGMLGAGLGAALAQLMTLPEGMELVAAGLLAVTGTVLLMSLAEKLVGPAEATVADLIAQGESADLEFKSAARHNMHTGCRDEKIELAIAKTVAGFLNSDGGTLLLGVADDGTVVGLEQDLAHMKSADTDRYELWLRDYLSRTLGAAAAALVTVSFPEVRGEPICRLDVARSPRPVFLRPARTDAVLFPARIGNATRELSVDQAILYAADHFPPEAGRLRAQVQRLVGV